MHGFSFQIKDGNCSCGGSVHHLLQRRRGGVWSSTRKGHSKFPAAFWSFIWNRNNCLIIMDTGREYSEAGGGRQIWRPRSCIQRACSGRGAWRQWRYKPYVCHFLPIHTTETKRTTRKGIKWGCDAMKWWYVELILHGGWCYGCHVHCMTAETSNKD